MRTTLAVIFIALIAQISPAGADAPRVLPIGTLPNDVRLKAPKDLNGYFPFTPPKSPQEWHERAEYVRRQVLVSQGLWPMPSKTPLNAVIHGSIDRPEYTVAKVYFESAPGFFVTGNLYRPKNRQGKLPGVLFAHGHWKDARLALLGDSELREQIATGAERFVKGGRSGFQSMCVQLARMGCVVWQWDMLGNSDSVQLSRDLVHGFAKQRPEMNTVENWGLFSPQAEAHLQSAMGLQTWNSIRSLDFLLSLPEVDPERIAMTGASGGGTQTMLLSAIDPRVALSFPAVMVSTSMQGGCTCENACLLRVNTGNIEFAALFAPKPLGMTTADDWTKEMSTKGFPELQQIYTVLGAPNNVMLHRGEHFPHNYNAVSRTAFYNWLNRHFALGFTEPVIEDDYDPLGREELSVWNDEHPAPRANDADFERALLRWFTDDAAANLQQCAASPERFRKEIGGAVEVLIGRSTKNAGDVEWELKHKQDRGNCLEMTGLLRNTTYDEELPVVWFYPKQWNGRVVVWLDDDGKSSLYDDGGNPAPAIKRLIDSGATVLGADLLFQGEFLTDGTPVTQTRTVDNPREAASYTLGYNHSLFARRAHDVLTLVSFLNHSQVGDHPRPTSVVVAGFGGAGPVVAAARAVASDEIDASIVDTGGFRFAKLRDFRDPMFLPGGAKYFDLPGMIALGAPHPLWLAGEESLPEVVATMYGNDCPVERLSIYKGEEAQTESAAVTWLQKLPTMAPH